MKCGINQIFFVVISNLKLVYESNWYSGISTVNSKIRTNCQFKTNFRQYNYVLFFNCTSQSAFSKLRRPVRMNLVLVRRVRAKKLLSMKAERVEHLTAWGPGARSRALGGVQGQSPGSSPGGSTLEAFGF